MKVLPLLVLLAGCASATRPTVKPAVILGTLPPDLQSCPLAPKAPKPPGAVRSPEQLLAYARALERARYQSVVARDACARQLDRLGTVAAQLLAAPR